ncbi:MAG: hypothetical protein FWD63_05180 [Propionibacteriaceae bacterium]|nr:hypothetical protein [Propionibacteriaceae bacterium]
MAEAHERHAVGSGVALLSAAWLAEKLKAPGPIDDGLWLYGAPRKPAQEDTAV